MTMLPRLHCACMHCARTALLAIAVVVVVVVLVAVVVLVVVLVLVVVARVNANAKPRVDRDSTERDPSCFLAFGLVWFGWLVGLVWRAGSRVRGRGESGKTSIRYPSR